MAKLEVDLLKNKNPELEKIRSEVLHSKGEDEKLAKNLASQLSTIHAAYLFSGCGRSALAQICTVISSTPACSNTAATSSWKDLGFHLGLTFHQICCIENYKYSDCTENVLKTYAQNMNAATLDKVIMALYELKRYDAISMAYPYLIALEKYARREQVVRSEEEDSGYHSVDGLESEEPTHDGILRPSGLRHLRSQLYITLRNLEIAMSDQTALDDKIEDNHQQAMIANRPRPQNKNKCSKRVMLTFAKDGEKIAYNVAAQLRKARGQYLPIGVLILDEHTELVEANPEQFITHYFPRVDYIIPIITPKYLETIDKNNVPEISLSSAIDTRYVQMIHTLMVKYYVGNSCRNDKFRSIIPDCLSCVHPKSNNYLT
uniref:40s ribosomal protein s12 n=1 Tax=Triatoma infestans TaxID=30076 RepID=A0A171B9S8_TRIIF